MEKIDVFDNMYNKTKPYSTSIDNIHKLGLWHQTFACWLINKKEKTIYIQLRGPKNRIGANTFDASSSGHLSSGETPQNGFRELKEELGKNIKIINKKFLGIFRNIFISKNYINKEFCNVFFASTNNSLDDFTLQKGEVFGIFKLKIKDGILLFSNKKEKVCVEGKVLKNDKYVKKSLKISCKDFNLYEERVKILGYYLKVMIMAERYIDNKFPIAI